MSTAKSVSNPAKGLNAESRKEWWKRYSASLRYSLYVITHPFDGFWDLIHEKRGTMAAAHTFLFLFLLTRVLKLMLTSFQFISAPIQHLNIFEEAASLLLPFLILCLANWAMTTLFDGKGKLGQVYMATCYGLIPYPVIQFPLMLLSNVVTVEEGQFYSVLSALSLVYAAILIVSAMGQIHEFSAGKNLLFTVASLFAMLVQVFILTIFFSMISQGVLYFISLVREFLFRL